VLVPIIATPPCRCTSCTRNPVGRRCLVFPTLDFFAASRTQTVRRRHDDVNPVQRFVAGRLRSTTKLAPKPPAGLTNGNVTR
jgi:hypothetical protein